MAAPHPLAMALAILGAGNVGLALGRAFSRMGEAVVFGVQDPAKVAAVASALGPGATVTTVAEAFEAAELLILAVPYGAIASISATRADWQGKILVYATNPLAPGLAGLSVGTTSSGAEPLAALARGARLVKAFTTTGAENMADTTYPNGRIFLPGCGDDPSANARW
jgi:predicted dinucleotide-binding enzyme